MVDVSHVEVFFDVFVSEYYGALRPIVNRGLTAHACELEPDWGLQLERWDTRSPA